MAAALLTVLMVVAGVVLGMSYGGRIDRVVHFRPGLWQVGAAGLAVELVLRIGGWSGGWAVAFDVLATLALIVFAVANLRLGGMVLVVAGLALNLVPSVVNWGTPTSRHALVTADVIGAGDGTVQLSGPRHVATDDDTFAFLGEVIALPTGQVISFGDCLLYVGYLLVAASLVRGRVLRRDPEGDYPRRIAPLGRGPARRRGPGLHPSRQPARRGGGR